MSLTITVPTPHLQMKPIRKPLLCERRFWNVSDNNTLHSPSKLPFNSLGHFTPWPNHLNPDLLTNLQTPLSLWSESSEQGETRKPAEEKPEEDDSLELSLGLSLGRPSCKSAANITGKKSLRSCGELSIGSDGAALNSLASKQTLRQENVPMKVETDRDGFVPEKTLWGNENRLCPEEHHNPAVPHGWKQQSVDGPRLTAAQIWQTIQRSSSLPEIVASTNAGNGSEALKGAAAADVWAQVAQRSTSMQFMGSLREGNHNTGLLRATSNCANVKSQQFVDFPPSSLVRQISRTESLHNKNSLIQQDKQQQETQELQRKKELQAKRRQEARKRRKSLIEEKQLKRAKREESKFLSRTKSSVSNSNQLLTTSSASFATQDATCSPTRDGGGIQRMGSSRWVQGWEASAPLHITSGGSLKDSERVGDHEERKRLFGLIKSEEEEDSTEVKGDKDALHDEEMLEEGTKTSLVSTIDGMERTQASRVRVQRTHPEATTIVQRRPRARGVGKANGMWRAEVDAREGKTCSEDCQSNSKSENRDEMEEPILTTQTDHEASSQKSAMESDRSTQTVVTSTPLPYAASSFPLIPLPYPFPIPLPTSSALPLQMGFSVPYYMQFLAPHPSSGPQDSPNSTYPQMLPPFQFPVRPGLTPYGLPMPEACIPWFPVTHSQSAVHPESGAPWAESSHGRTEHDRGSSNETEAKDVDLQNLSPNSVQGNSSSRKTKGQGACFTPLPRKLLDHSSHVGSQTSLVHLGLTRTVSDSAQLGPTCGAFESGERVLPRARSGDPFVGEAAAAPGKPQILSTNKAPAPGARVVPSAHRERKGSSMAAKGSPSHSNTEDPITSEVCSSSEGNGGSVAAEEDLFKEACNSQPGVAIPGESGCTRASPDLPWVSTTGPAPNGTTVTGAMYIFNKNQVKIVCTCHAKHMSPSEFVQHAGHTDLSNPERNIIVNSFPHVGDS